MRIMGLDIGEKRIGIAISDPMGWTAQGHTVLNRKNLKQDLKIIAQICEEYEVTRIVLGLPLNMDGSIGVKVVEVKEFGKRLAGFTGLVIDYWDERLTTKSAERVLIAADVSRKKRKKVIDKMAAVNILQTYLNNRSTES
jgi:putative Holliday junction resolvase